MFFNLHLTCVVVVVVVVVFMTVFSANHISSSVPYELKTHFCSLSIKPSGESSSSIHNYIYFRIRYFKMINV